MTIVFTFADLFALSPLVIILMTALLVLSIESLCQHPKNWVHKIALLGIAIAILASVFSPGSQSELLTRWIAFDSFTKFFTLFFLAIGWLCCLLAHSFFKHHQTSQGEYYFLLLAALFGLILVASAADFLTLFLGLETLSIALYVLCAYMKKWELAGEAAIKYFLMGSLATAFLLYGVALLYGWAGTTNFALIAQQPIPVGSQYFLFFGGIAMIILGLAFKAALVPFHLWAPDVYDGAPNPVTAFMATGIKVGAFAVFARIFLFSFSPFNPVWNDLLISLSIATMIYANFVALRQIHLRRFFAYSGISHAGFLLIPIIARGSDALNSLEFYLVIYTLATLGCFAILTTIEFNRKNSSIEDLKGLFYRSPWQAGAFAFCLLTLAAIPPTPGFFAKFYVFKIAFQSGHILLVVIGLLTTILAVYYYLRIISVMFTPKETEQLPIQMSWPSAVVIATSSVSLIVFIFYPEILNNFY